MKKSQSIKNPKHLNQTFVQLGKNKLLQKIKKGYK